VKLILEVATEAGLRLRIAASRITLAPRSASRDCAVEGRVVTRLAIQSWLIAVNLILCQFCWAYLLLKKGFSIFRLLILEQSKNRTI